MREFENREVDVNVFRENGVWCSAIFVDDEFDCSDPLGIPDNSSEEFAKRIALSQLAPRYLAGKSVSVWRIDDV